MSVEVVRAAALAAAEHGFLGRTGGVSTGELAGLNVGTGSSDDREAIAENRRRAVAAVLPGANLATVHQVHSAEAVYVAQPWPQEERPKADAMVTDRPGLLLGILTADCAPVLFADFEAGVVGAAHAGWRGAFAGVTDSTIAAMEGIGARRERIAAAIGPCIAMPSYEVDAAFRDRFIDADPANDRFFVQAAAETLHFDLPAYVRHRLVAGGVEEVETIHLDTYSSPDRFYSFRRSTHRGEADYGRQVALIGLKR
ncbi:peptidoglycan editing factor PgeF [Sphingomonas sabuli]|uniref:Purine nucleoside phosphorylase n=1 Tax=Sphingomonas sabuli TaxID=2764186 RepID=A0A7G9L1B8_9SPHN|nr:peptidoglycan editing factor PgeF [Sphingomonas sabuli]QNM82417.1 peptidoglycan editing factor PgeF [Sphingomonas sabuli]